MVMVADWPDAIVPRLQVIVAVPEHVPRLELTAPAAVVAAGTASVTVATVELGPWLVTVSTTENAVPSVTLTATAVVTPRSAPPALATPLVAVAELLAGFASSVVADTDAVLAIDPLLLGVVTIVTVAPAVVTAPRLQVTVRVALANVHPCALTKSSEAGKTSVTTVLSAVSGPELVIVAV